MLTPEQIYHDWDQAVANNDMDALLSLYADDAVLESPLIPYLMKTESGVLKGKEQLRLLLGKVAERKPAIRKNYKQNFFTDGKVLMFEYPRITPNGEQMDFMEVMDLVDAKIQYHRVYWGWHGVKVIQDDLYSR
jgi:hypothetical protein